MAGYDVTVGKELLPNLLNESDGLARLVETVSNPAIRRSGSGLLVGDRTHQGKLLLGESVIDRYCGLLSDG